jgi:hypothetical protein
LSFRKAYGYHSCVAEDLILLGCDTVIGCIVPDVSKNCCASIFRVKQFSPFTLLNPEDEGMTILGNAKNYIANEIASHPRRTKSSSIISFFTDILETVHLLSF